MIKNMNGFSFSAFHWLVIAFIIGPVLVPLFFWFVLRKRDLLNLYRVARVFRFALAALACVLIVMDFLNHRNGGAEAAGGILGRVLVIYLLCRRWDRRPKVPAAEVTTPGH